MFIKSKLSIKILLFLMIILNQIFSSTFKISGKVIDKSSGLALAGANVFLEGTSIGIASDKEGKYELVKIKKGKYIIKVTYIGYNTLSDTLIIGVNKTNIIQDFKLEYTTIQGSEINVTSQAKGQIDAINRQLNTKSLVNIISSDKINELPDANAAETVARSPGVSIKREGGEGNKIVVRGLSPKYNSITVNGVELASTDNEDRSTDISMISQYMIESIDITKAGTPDKDGEVLGGTVNFELKKAKPGFHGNIILQGMHNGMRDSYNDQKFVLDLSRRYWKNKFGILAQIDQEKRNRSSHEVGVDYNLFGERLDQITTLQLTNFNLNDWTRLNKRDNRLIVLDTELPFGNFTYSNLNSKITKDIFSYVISYELTNNGRGMRSMEGVNDIQILTESLKYEQTFFNKIIINFLSSFSKSNSELKNNRFNFGESFAYAANPTNQSIEYVQQVAKNDTGNMIFDNYDYRLDKSVEKEHAIKFDVKYKFRLGSNFSGHLKIGKKWKKKLRNYDMHFEYGSLGSIYDYGKYAIVQHFDLAPYIVDRGRLSLFAFLDENYEGDNFFKEKYTFGAVADLSFMMNLYDYVSANWNRQTVSSIEPRAIIHNIHQTNSQIYDYSGEENYTASYIMGDIDLGDSFNIITGFRNEKVQTIYHSQKSVDHIYANWIYIGEATSHKRVNSIYLPGLFIIYKPNSWLKFRLSNTKTLTRPNYTSIIPLERVNGMDRTIDWRNKFLKPGISDNIDIGFSIHQNKLGFISLGYFRKYIKDLIFSSNSKVVLPDDTSRFDLSSNFQYYKIFNHTTNNPYIVKVNGVEIDYQTRFWYLPKPLNGFVFNANYTLINSKANYPQTIVREEIIWDPIQVNKFYVDTTYVDRLLDQPNEIMNFSVGYDYKGFSGRLSMLFNDDVFMSTAFWPALRQTTDYYRKWDLSIKQNLPIDGISIYFNINNMTETNDVNRYYGRTSEKVGGNNLSSEQYYGKTIDLGFRYSF